MLAIRSASESSTAATAPLSLRSASGNPAVIAATALLAAQSAPGRSHRHHHQKSPHGRTASRMRSGMHRRSRAASSPPKSAPGADSVPDAIGDASAALRSRHRGQRSAVIPFGRWLLSQHCIRRVDSRPHAALCPVERRLSPTVAAAVLRSYREGFERAGSGPCAECGLSGRGSSAAPSPRKGGRASLRKVGGAAPLGKRRRRRAPLGKRGGARRRTAGRRCGALW
ncbi:hypothetical protein BJY16_001730 [Actinoplanes octamycinicus]|uniref:Uncharacterized protein n=1 Tax=Actinoplanes octamycinicus TaxID=135948 RepID=A0A7W7M629_9ACTN|nr:hypothetical protein [Actinoplanes octamycinicus]